jgi:sugar lactone lactonase YvrE
MAPPAALWNVRTELETEDLVWAESPRWRDGELFVSDTQGSRLIVIGSEETRVHELESPVNGTGFLPSGLLVAARMHGKRLERFDGAEWQLHADLGAIVTGRLGDLLALRDGSVYVDDVSPNEPGQLLLVDAAGRPSVAAEDLIFPNGLALTDAGHTLIVAETYAGRLTAFTVAARNQLEDRRPWIDLRAILGPEYLPDGICSSRDGSIWVATTNGRALVRVENGEVRDEIDLDAFVIACCLNDDESELYVTVAASLDAGVPVTEAVYKKRTRARVVRLDRSNDPS